MNADWQAGVNNKYYYSLIYFSNIYKGGAYSVCIISKRKNQMQ
jgi:hypothetical protein